MSTILMTYGNDLRLPNTMAGDTLLQPEKGLIFSKETLLELLPACDAVIAATRFDRGRIAACKKVKLIVSYGAGYDHIDLRVATEAGIPVVNIPDSVTEGTAQLAIALMLAVGRRMGEFDRKMRALPSTRDLFYADWRRSVELTGRTLGIVGMGRIGTRVAELARAFRMHIVYTSRTEKTLWADDAPKRLPLDELLRQSDFVSLHCPLTAETAGLIGRDELALMKPGAYFINTARGKIVDEQALLDALEGGRIAGAGVDVYAQEPEISPRWKTLDNAVLMPHIGGNAQQTRILQQEQCLTQIRRVLTGQKPDNLLNPEVYR